MRVFDIEIEEVLRRVVSVEAETFEDALEEVKRMYREEEIVLTADDWQETTYREGYNV